MSNDIELYDARMDGDKSYPMKAFCTVDMTNPEGQKVVFNALSDALPLSQYTGVDIPVSDVMLEPGTRKSRGSGESMQCMNTYLITPDGTAYFSQSDGVFRSIYNLLTIYKDGIRNSANGGFLMMRCIEKQLPSGNTIKKLVLV